MYSRKTIKFVKRIGFKITLWYLFSVLAIITLVGISLYYHLQQKLSKETDNLLIDEIADILPAKSRNKLNIAKLNVAIVRETSNRKYHQISARLLDLNSNVVVTSANFFTPPLQLSEKAMVNAKNGIKTIETVYLSSKTSCYRLLTEPVFKDDSLIYVLQIAIFLKDSFNILKDFSRDIFLYIPIIVVITAFGGWFISRKSLSPLGRIIKSTREITYLNLNKRLERLNSGDELEELTNTINSMLNRLEDSFKKNVQFTSDASHELRTPITGLKAGTEVILAKERSAEEYRELHENNLIVFEEITRMIEDLFVLLKSDYGLKEMHCSSFALDGMLNELYTRFSLLSDAKDINFSIKKTTQIQICGVEPLLKRVFANIIDNAIKYTPDGKRIYLSLEKKNGNAIVSIQDEGKGLSEENKSKIFDRFYRVDQSRSRETGGAGLGLCICRNIVELHNGKIEVKSRLGEGSTFVVTLPMNGRTKITDV